MSENLAQQDTNESAEGSQEVTVERPALEAEVETKAVEEQDEGNILYPSQEDSKESPEVPAEKEAEEAPKKEDQEQEEDYDIELPEDTKLEEADKERIVSFAKEHGLSKEAAQKLIESEDERIVAFEERAQGDFQEKVANWEKEVRSDKELGGEKLAQTQELAKRALTRFGNEELLQLLSSGFGNHPAVVRTFARIGREMTPREMVRSGVHSGGDKSMEDLFYGNKTDS